MTFAKYKRVTSVREENMYIALHNLRVQEEDLARKRGQQRSTVTGRRGMRGG